MIVTKTDPQGRITYANDVFLRVSALDERDAVGQPHNVIRHPDMPACVFKLLWETIQDRREIFAYVLNLAADGAHYWVFAHVTPSADESGRTVGFHSNRRLPDRAAIEEISALYARLRAEERRHERTPDAIAASTALLESHLDGAGMTYAEYVWHLTNGATP